MEADGRAPTLLVGHTSAHSDDRSGVRLGAIPSTFYLPLFVPRYNRQIFGSLFAAGVLAGIAKALI